MPWAALAVSLFIYVLVAATPVSHGGDLMDVRTFIAVPQHWIILGCMMMVSVCGGIYMVPLYAMLQSHTPPEYRSRVMAASNLSDSVFMTLAALASAGLLAIGFGITDLFLLVATLNLAVVAYVRKVVS